jgi:DNA-binding NarL/FixJ family response regulator
VRARIRALRRLARVPRLPATRRRFREMGEGPHHAERKCRRSSCPMIRIAVLDDHPAVLGGLQRLAERAPDLEPIAFVETEAALRRALDQRLADVVLVDYDLARGDGLAVCQHLKERGPAPRVVIYSAYAGPGLGVAARAAGADGLVHKSEPVAELLAAVRLVADGKRVLPELQPDLRRAAMSRLDEEDLAVAAMLLVNTPHDAIAETLDVRRKEVAWRARRIVARMRPSGASSDSDKLAGARPG